MQVKVINRILGCLALSVALAQQLSAGQVASAGSATSQWLLAYDGRTANDVIRDPRFRTLAGEGLPHYHLEWDKRPLSQSAPDFLWGSPNPVSVSEGHYVTIIGVFPRVAVFKGLLWCDTEKEPGEILFVILTQNQAAGKTDEGTLDIYSNKADLTSALPKEFVASLQQWEKETQITRITSIKTHNAQDRASTLPLSVLNESTTGR